MFTIVHLNYFFLIIKKIKIKLIIFKKKEIIQDPYHFLIKLNYQ